ncbi:hypothetical protein [Mycobacterium sp. MAA66]|uniref:hypothetical protein n=1 Tax=Mycobacterium sp. MAA66 TaxID=3156297 RepID=UPI00351637CA
MADTTGGTERLNAAPDEIRELLTILASRTVEGDSDRADADAAFARVANRAVDLWQSWWASGRETRQCHVPQGLNAKFVVVFGLAAHALNHVKVALQVRSDTPGVAKSCVRIALEHALTAQWVMLTEYGEREVLAKHLRSDYIRLTEMVGAIREINSTDSVFAAGHGLSDEQLQRLLAVVDNPISGGPPNMIDMCGRFAGGAAKTLFYDLQRDFSGAVHTSNALIISHLRQEGGTVKGVDWTGSQLAVADTARVLAMASTWALYVLEVCRAGQPNIADVLALGQHVQLPVDLRMSDQSPQKQPTGDRAYWNQEVAGPATI